MSYEFGVGTLVGVRTDISNPTPAQFATLQDVQVDFDFTLKELMGQYQAPVAFGRAGLKIQCKAKQAAFKASLFNNIFFGQTAATGLLSQAIGEAGAVPGSSTYTVTVANSSAWVTDLGVVYASGANAGVAFTRVASGPATGQYSVSAGVYTFASGDANANVLISYTYTVNSGGTKITLNNQLMGSGPTFQANLTAPFSQFGTTKVFNLQLNYCVSSKLSLPFKNEDFAIQEFDWQAGADAANVIGYISLTDP